MLDPLSRMQCQCPARRSTVENTLASSNSGRRSSKTGRGYHSRLCAAFNGFGSTRTLNGPDFFVVTTTLLIHGIGSSTFAMTPKASSLFSSSLKFSLSAVGTRLVGGNEGFYLLVDF